MGVAVGMLHTVLLRSDGAAVACGGNFEGQCRLPALAGGVTYTQVAGGACHTILLRSDGAAVACGRNVEGQCNLPALDEGVTYTSSALLVLVLQASFDGACIIFTTLAGDEFNRFEAAATDRLSAVYSRLTRESGRSRVDAVSRAGSRMSSILQGRPEAS